MKVEKTNNIDLKSLAKLETPFLAIDLDVVEQNYSLLKKTLPNVRVFYAMKSNPEQKILLRLMKLGCDFEIASIGELHRLEKIGYDPKRAIFSNTVKIRSHIAAAHRSKIHSFAFDSADEIKKISEEAPGAKVYLRVSVSNHGSIINLSNKFGAEMGHALQLMELAKDFGLEPYGLAFHVGSQSENVHLWREAIERMGKLIEQLKKIDIEIKVINMGGGFPIAYTEPVPDLKDVAEEIAQSCKEYLPKNIELWIEPGRALVGDAGIIGATVIGHAIRKNSHWLFLDVGRFQAFVEMFESEQLRYPVMSSRDHEYENGRHLFTLTGPSCDSYDTIMDDVALPADMKEGDKLYFGSAGAYTHVYGSSFNDFPVPRVVYKKFGKI